MLEFEAILTLTDSHPLHHMIQPYWLQLGKHSSYIGLSWALKEAFLKYQLKTVSSNRFYKYVKQKHSAYAKTGMILAFVSKPHAACHMLIQPWDRGNNDIFDTDKALQQKFAANLWDSYHWYMWRNLLMIRKFSIPNALLHSSIWLHF